MNKRFISAHQTDSTPPILSELHEVGDHFEIGTPWHTYQFATEEEGRRALAAIRKDPTVCHSCSINLALVPRTLLTGVDGKNEPLCMSCLLNFAHFCEAMGSLYGRNRLNSL